MMRIATTRFGLIEVPEDALVTLPSGLVGLGHYTRFVVIEEEDHATFQWLQAVEEPGLAVVVVDANFIRSALQVDLSDDVIAEIELHPDDPVALYLVVTIPKDQPEQATVNLRGPIVMNLRTRKAKQLVLHEAWPVKYPLCGDAEPVDDPQNAHIESSSCAPSAPAGCGGGSAKRAT